MEELAENVDKAFRSFDPYEYADADMDSEKVADMVRLDPYQVIKILTEMIEELIE